MKNGTDKLRNKVKLINIQYIIIYVIAVDKSRSHYAVVIGFVRDYFFIFAQ